MSGLQISIDNISLDFTHHLKNNNRILFSGAYGTGKTYFLKKYFEERKEEYNVFHIFPVNYQVSQNEDIFELIKIDILYHILMKGWNLDTQEKENISKTIALQAYTINNSPGIFQNLLKIFTFGKSDTIVKPLNELEEISNKFSKYYDEINKDGGSLSIVRKFTQELKYTRGSIYEFDNITQLIYDLLENHKTKEEEGDIKEEIDSTQIQNVLIIDDIDRIDPEHIFRILNIFSAHFDIENEDNNKFGFDKIIFVCDINNIRNIFCTKYGLNTDFNGYINKFFNSHIYEFDNYDEIEKGFNDYIIDLTNKNNVNSIYSSFSPTLRKIINHLIYSNEINIRHLQNLEKINWHKTEIKVSNEILNNFPFYNLLRVLLFVFNNDKEKLINAFQRLRFNNEFDMRYDNLIAVLLPLIQSKKYANPSYIERGKPYVYDNEKLDLKIIYRINNYSNNYYIAEVLGVGFYNDKYKILSDKHEENIKVVWNNDMSVGSIIKEFTEKDNYYLLIEAIKSLEESNLLKNWVTRH